MGAGHAKCPNCKSKHQDWPRGPSGSEILSCGPPIWADEEAYLSEHTAILMLTDTLYSPAPFSFPLIGGTSLNVNGSTWDSIR
jgi:hypothetical protein